MMIALPDYIYNLGHYLTDTEFSVAMTVLDKDGNSKITYDEFVDWYKSEQSEDRLQHLHLDDAAVQAAQRCSEYFQFFDQTKTGTLNGEEFTTMYGYMVQGGYALAEFSSCIKELDANEDGVIQFNEFMRWMVKMGALKIDEVRPIQVIQPAARTYSIVDTSAAAGGGDAGGDAGGGAGGDGDGAAEVDGGWVEYLDPRTNRNYYHRARDGKTVWEKPAEMG